jgi:molybdate transport system ATP-binding protein
MTVVLRDVVQPLSDFTLEVSLTIDGPATALYGSSGAGKTTLLEIIAGLRRPELGSVAIDDRVVFDAASGIAIPPRDLRIGYVPQDDTLFPHMSVRRNIRYGAGDDRDFAHVTSVLEIDHLLDRATQRLSGGERKRVSLARALLRQPVLLLLDEPLTGVDPALRSRVLDYLVRMREEFPIPLIYVTHDREEAERICDASVRMERGRVPAS